MKKISIIVPCFNESTGLLAFIDELVKFINSFDLYAFEVIFVDDGSSDNSFIILNDMSKHHQWITVLSFTRNFGKEAALTAGLDYASGDAIVFMDADLQHPFDVVRLFIQYWEQGEKVVVGKRTNRKADSIIYKIFAETFYFLHNKISDTKLPENVGDFRLVDSEVANQLKRLHENRRFMKGLFAWLGYSPVYVEYTVAPRVHGVSKFSKLKSWNFALEGITSFSTIPLVMWSYLGGMVFVLGVIYSIVILLNAIIYGVVTPGYVTLLTAIVTFGGVQLIGIGVLGEYIGRIYLEVKKRPHYLINKVINHDLIDKIR